MPLFHRHHPDDDDPEPNDDADADRMGEPDDDVRAAFAQPESEGGESD